MGYFSTTIETKNKITTSKVFVVDHYDAGNLLSFDSGTELNLIEINKEQTGSTNAITTDKAPATMVTEEEQKTNEIKRTIVEEFHNVFEGRGKLKNYQCKLYVNKDIKPVAQKHRRQPYHIRKTIKEEVERLEAEDVVEKVSGPQEWVSNVVATPKSNGKVRLCLDARVINTAIERETYPIPTLESIVDKMNGAKLFAKLDLKEAYSQLELEENSRNMTCFHTENGIYRYKRLVYGINNSFEIFQRAMEQTIGEMEGVKFISDDIIIHASNDEKLLQTLRKVISKIQSHNLKLNLDKCIFRQTSIKYFGIVFSKDGISPDPEKVEALREAQSPTNVNDVRSFLGLCNYVSRFIPQYSEKTAPLRELLKKNIRFKWTEQHEKSFTELKNELTSEKVLKFYDPNKPVTLITDASDYAVGGVLLQADESGFHRPICYISKSLSSSEINWGPTEKEAYAVVWSVEKLHLYLYEKRFKIIVDHQPLKFIFAPRSKLNARIARWQLRLQCYNFDIDYQKGSENIADFVSRIRRTDTSLVIEKTTKHFVNFVKQNAVPKAMTLEEVQLASEQDVVIQAVRHAIRTNHWYGNPLIEPYTQIKYELSDADGVLLRGDRIVLPERLRKRAMQIAHEGHLGTEKCKSLIRMKLYWPKMNMDIEEFVKDCIPCKANSKENAPEPLNPSDLPKAVWSQIAIDFYGPVPSGEKLLVTTDMYSRFPLVEIMKNTNANAVINKLKKQFATYGYPSKLRSDNGPPFNSSKFREYLDNSGIIHVKITPYHPKANATVERFMQVLNKSLRTATFSGYQWKDQLDTTLLQYRNAIHGTTGATPAELFFNRKLNDKLPTIVKPSDSYDKINRQQQKQFAKAKQYHDEKRKAKESDIKVGDHVIIKETDRPNKMASSYSKTIYEVIERKKSLITVKDDFDNVLTRNVTWAKKVKKPETVEKRKETIIKNEHCKTEKRKVYPKRHRKPIQR